VSDQWVLYDERSAQKTVDRWPCAGIGTWDLTVYARQVYVTSLIRRHVILKLGDEFEFWTVHVVFETREYTQFVVRRKCCSVSGEGLRSCLMWRPTPLWRLSVLTQSSTTSPPCDISEVLIANGVTLKDRTSFQAIMTLLLLSVHLSVKSGFPVDFFPVQSATHNVYPPIVVQQASSSYRQNKFMV